MKIRRVLFKKLKKRQVLVVRPLRAKTWLELVEVDLLIPNLECPEDLDKHLQLINLINILKKEKIELKVIQHQEFPSIQNFPKLFLQLSQIFFKINLNTTPMATEMLMLTPCIHLLSMKSQFIHLFNQLKFFKMSTESFWKNTKALQSKIMKCKEKLKNLKGKVKEKSSRLLRLLSEIINNIIKYYNYTSL